MLDDSLASTGKSRSSRDRNDVTTEIVMNDMNTRIVMNVTVKTVRVEVLDVSMT